MKERIQQVLEIEKRANEALETATFEAEKLPVQAEHEARELIEKSHHEAQEQARRILADARTEDESKRILDLAEEAAKRTKAQAMNNFDRAVSYVLNRVIGKE